MVEKSKMSINEEEGNVRGWWKKFKKTISKSSRLLKSLELSYLTKDRISKNNVVGNIEMDLKKWVEKI